LASPHFWELYNALPEEVKALADKSFALLKLNPRHPSLHFKRINKFWSARIGDHYRVLGVEVKQGIYWIWIGSHAEYDRTAG
jgi:hypothetical protein